MPCWEEAEGDSRSTSVILNSRTKGRATEILSDVRLMTVEPNHVTDIGLSIGSGMPDTHQVTTRASQKKQAPSPRALVRSLSWAVGSDTMAGLRLT